MTNQSAAPARSKPSSLAAQGQPALSISVRNLTKIYSAPFSGIRSRIGLKIKPPVTALKGVSFDVAQGEVFGLIGRNGAGKTTLTKIVATLIQPTAGTVSVCGFDTILSEKRVKSLVGLANAEERSSYWRLTAEENLLFFARLYGIPETGARRRVSELFEKLELTGVARRRFGELSTGNKQRVAVARALITNPPILLLDEPTRSLDPLAAARMRALIASLSSETPPVTVLLTSHNLAEVEELCTRVAIISGGEIRGVDDPLSLRVAYGARERVCLTVHGASPEILSRALSEIDSACEIDATGAGMDIFFSRQSGDENLDRAVRLVQSAGGRIISIDSKLGGLLDVLETVESETDAGGHPL